MSVRTNRDRFLQSWGLELRSQSKRVRDLIGDRHWLSDGHHKEYIFLSLLQSRLPSGFRASRGFVVDPHNHNSVSTEQDLLVFDNRFESPLFNEGNLAIVFPSQVACSISIKTTFNLEMVRDSVNGLASVQRLIESEICSPSAWLGSYYFEKSCAQPATYASWLKDSLTDTDYQSGRSGQLHYLVCEGLLTLRATQELGDSTKDSIRRVLSNASDGLETSLFLAHLLDHVAFRAGANSSTLLSSLDSLPPKQFLDPIEF